MNSLRIVFPINPYDAAMLEVGSMLNIFALIGKKLMA